MDEREEMFAASDRVKISVATKRNLCDRYGPEAERPAISVATHVGQHNHKGVRSDKLLRRTVVEAIGAGTRSDG